MSDGTSRDWAWRRWLRSNRVTHTIYMVLVAVVGLSVVILGLVLVPAPGPGWLIVLVGLLILSTEFAWARRLRDRLVDRLRAWNAWVMARSLGVRALISLATLAFLLGMLWISMRVFGVPPFLPPAWSQWLHAHAGL